MKPSSRRDFLRTSPAISPLVVAGCIDLTNHQTVHLQLVNGRPEDYTVTITDEEEDAAESIFVEANGFVHIADWLEPGRYDLDIELDSGQSTEYELPPDCEEQLLSITIDHPQGFRIEYSCWQRGEFETNRSHE